MPPALDTALLRSVMTDYYNTEEQSERSNGWTISDIRGQIMEVDSNCMSMETFVTRSINRTLNTGGVFARTARRTVPTTSQNDSLYTVKKES